MLSLRAPRALSLASRIWGSRLCGVSSYVWEEGEKDGMAGGTRPNVVHPTAVVHPGAVIGQGVSVGPFCTVGSSVKLGDSCQMHPPGDECFLHIGDNNDIREHTSIHRSSKSSDKTVIGNNNLIMGSCHIAHDCKVGNSNILANNTLLAGHVVVEDCAHTAGATVVHQFCHLGSHCFIGGGSVVSQDVPKYMMVSGERAELRGLNSKGLHRHGFSHIEIQGMRRAYQKIFMPTEGSPESIEDRLLEVEQNRELFNFPAVSSMVRSIRDSFQPARRGICRFRNWLAIE